MHMLGPLNVPIKSEAVIEVSDFDSETSQTAFDWIGAFKGPNVRAQRFSSLPLHLFVLRSVISEKTSGFQATCLYIQFNLLYFRYRHSHSALFCCLGIFLTICMHAKHFTSAVFSLAVYFVGIIELRTNSNKSLPSGDMCALQGPKGSLGQQTRQHSYILGGNFKTPS